MTMTMTTYGCPVEITVEMIAGRWTPVILAHLKEAPAGYAELRRLVPGISEKMLSQRLAELTDRGLVYRIELRSTPPRTRYELTDEGHTLGAVLQAMWEWGDQRARTHALRVAPRARR